MSYSEMKAGIDSIADALVGQRAVLTKSKTNAQSASNTLGDIPVTFGAVIAEIQAIPPDTSNPAEALLKAELAKLTDEFVALKGIADQVAAIDV